MEFMREQYKHVLKTNSTSSLAQSLPQKRLLRLLRLALPVPRETAAGSAGAPDWKPHSEIVSTVESTDSYMAH